MTTSVPPSDRSRRRTLVGPGLLFFLGLMIYAVAIKLLPYFAYRFGLGIDVAQPAFLWGISPLFAIGLFGGAVCRRRSIALLIPPAALLAGDLGIWATTGNSEWAFYPNQPVVYLSMAISAVLGFAITSRKQPVRIGGLGVAACVQFFLLTNFAVWVGSVTYPQNMTGLLACYAAGLPYLLKSIVATGVYSALLFSPLCVRDASEVAVVDRALEPVRG